jgi:ABC-type Fe3+/spermidine/putrescine transport system ATPase subunit
LGVLVAGDNTYEYVAEERVTVLIRPEAAEVCSAATGPNVISGRLREVSFRGGYYLIRTEHAGQVTLTCEAAMAGDRPLIAGESIALWLNPAAITLLATQESNLRSTQI